MLASSLLKRGDRHLTTTIFCSVLDYMLRASRILANCAQSGMPGLDRNLANC
jgi:hypothetical protein